MNIWKSYCYLDPPFKRTAVKNVCDWYFLWTRHKVVELFSEHNTEGSGCKDTRNGLETLSCHKHGLQRKGQRWMSLVHLNNLLYIFHDAHGVLRAAESAFYSLIVGNSLIVCTAHISWGGCILCSKKYPDFMVYWRHAMRCYVQLATPGGTKYYNYIFLNWILFNLRSSTATLELQIWQIHQSKYNLCMFIVKNFSRDTLSTISVLYT